MPDQLQSSGGAVPGTDHVPDLSYLVEALINNVGSGIYLAQDRKFVFVNHFLEELSGYNATDLIGYNTLDFVHPDDKENVLTRAVEALKDRGSTVPSYEYRFIKKNGETMWVVERISSIEYRGRRAVLGSLMDINRRKLLEEELVIYGEKYRNILERMQDSYYELDLRGNFTFVNYATCQNLGYEWGELDGKNYRTIIPEEAQDEIFQVFHGIYESGEPNKGFSHKVTRKDGSMIFVESSVSLLLSDSGKPVGFTCVSRDVTERKRLEEELARSEEKYRTILSEIEDAYYEVDLKGNFTFANDACLRDLRCLKDDVLGVNFRRFVVKEDVADVVNNFNQVYRTGEANRGFSHRVLRKDGTTGYAEASVSLIRNKQGNAIGFRAVSRDVTERKKLEQKLAEMATHDFLTGLPNRILLNDRFYVAVAHAPRNDSKLAVMSLDIDNFKIVNDTLGHSAGDELLRMVAIRLSYTMRTSDTVARIGGDEFVLLLQDIHDLEDAISIAEKIVDSFKIPFVIEGHYLNITTSIGLVIYPDEGRGLDILMRKSDAAMYHSKKEGGNRYKVFSDSDQQELKD